MLRAAVTGAVSRVAVRSAAPAVRPMAMGNEKKKNSMCRH
jgi:hypothetical protein